jgi:phage shock protein C
MKTYEKRLFKSSENKIISGVIGGLGEYFDVDPVLLRVGYVLITVFTAVFPGIIAYILMSMVVPKKPRIIHKETESVN